LKAGNGITMEQTSNQQLFAQYYEEFMPKIFSYIHFKVDSEQTTEDLTSVVFEKALSNFMKYSRDKAAFSTWIFAIARNTVIDYYRTESKRKHFDLEAAVNVASSESSPEEKFEKINEKECLLRCLSGLGEKDQDIIHLKFGAELSNREIARVLHLSESNVGVRLFRAVKKLKEDFEETWSG
jgi:RNA polymerase sigma factor (sigma-70 family)